MFTQNKVMQISSNLTQLASLIFPLYIVGGAVRDHLLNFSIHDIDLTSPLTPDEVIEKLANTKFRVKPNSLKLGTLSININDESYEFTSMREDSYLCNGTHKPSDIKFTKDILKDAKRRDFTVNALYYDISNRKIIDPLGAIGAIETKILITTRDAESVFKEDALRILRMVRIACENGFSIDKDTYDRAKNNSHLIEALAVERIRDEFMQILVADKKNILEGAHYKGLKMLVDIGAMAYIIPDLIECIDYPQNADYHIYDVYEHIMQTVLYAKENVRLAALFHDIAKPYCKKTFNKMAYHDKYSAQTARNIMTKLRYSNNEIINVERLVYSHMFNLKGEAKAATVRRFIQKNYDIIDDVLDLMTADGLASRAKSPNSTSKLCIIEELKFMKENNIPFAVKDLLVDGNDAISLGLKGKQIGESLSKLLYNVVADNTLLNRENQLKFLAGLKGK